MQMRGKWIQIRLKVKRVRKQQGSLMGGCDTRSRLPLVGLRGLSSFTTTATANHWGRTNHDLRRVETALKTIVLCEGEELGRGLRGQRGLHSGPAVLSSCLNLCLYLMSHMQFQFSMTLT